MSAITLQGGSGNTSLRAQIARVEKERSECVNCASAKTLQGKQNIQSLDSEIKTLKAQLTTTQPTASTVGGRIDVYA